MRISRCSWSISLTAALLSASAARPLAADFQPSPPPVPWFEPPERAQAPAGLTMGDLQAFAAAAAFDDSSGSDREKAARWARLAAERPRLAESARARSEQWEMRIRVLSLLKERMTRAARAEDFERLSLLLRADEHSSAEKSEWAARYTRVYEAFPGFSIEDFDAMLAVFPAGALRKRLEGQRARKVAALKAALERTTGARPELSEALKSRGAEVVFRERDGAHRLEVVETASGRTLFTCESCFTASGDYPDIDANNLADEALRFLKKAAP